MADTFDTAAILLMTPLVLTFMALAGMNYIKGEEIAQMVRHNACLNSQEWARIRANEANQTAGERDGGGGREGTGQAKVAGAVKACP